MAKDQDGLGAAVQYSIDGEGSKFFSVNTFTGMVTVSDMEGMVRSTQYLLNAKVRLLNSIYVSLTTRENTQLYIIGSKCSKP